MRILALLIIAHWCASCFLTRADKSPTLPLSTSEAHRFFGEWITGEPSATGHYSMRLVITEATAQLFEDGELVLRGPTLFKDGKLLINAEMNNSRYYREPGGCWAQLHYDNMSLSLFGNTKGLICFDRKIAGPTRLSGDSRIAMLRFQEALRAGQWPAALALCSGNVRTKAAEYSTEEAFFRDVLPLELLVARRGFSVCGSTRKGPGDGELIGLTCFLRRPVEWTWSLNKTDNHWVVEFPTRSLAVWDQEKLAAITRWRKEREAREKTLDANVANVSTRLTTVAGTRFVRGAGIALRLELVNGGNAVLWYDDQQVGVNASFKVEDSQGKAVPYGASPCQTFGTLSPIQPGQTIVLLGDFDLTEQYRIPRAGEYRVQFTGSGLSICDTRGDDSPDPSPVYSTKVFASNVLTIRLD